MVSYFFKRLFLFVPTLLLISLLIFLLSKAAAGDPVLDKLERESRELRDNSFERILPLKKKLGLDLPNFYFSIYRKTACPYPNKIATAEVLGGLEFLAFQIGSWDKVKAFYEEINQLQQSSDLTEEQKLQLSKLLYTRNLEVVVKTVREFNEEDFQRLKKITAGFHRVAFSWNNHKVKFQWNGFHNQYHNWMGGLLQGKFGNSYQDGRLVSNKVFRALYWTLILSSISLFLAFSIAIPTAVYAAAKPGGKLDRIASTLFFGFYALPTFWVATLLIVFFSSGAFFKFFPTYGLGQIPIDATFLEIINIRSSHLVLPIFCCTYGSLAFIYRQLRASMQQQLEADYIKTALSKGVPWQRLLWRHAFKNASFPLLTMLGSALPAMVSGAFVVEYIFAIPGMGKLTVDSFLARDFPVIFAIVLLISLLTLIGSWLSDVAYHIADPRFQINTSKK